MIKMTGNLTRRAALAGAPATAAGALIAGTAVNAVAVAMARAAEVDPIFAVIRAHQADVEAYVEACEKGDEEFDHAIGGSLAARSAYDPTHDHRRRGSPPRARRTTGMA